MLNAGEDVLVFYNDNKASFHQFVEMMQKESDRQYQEDIQILRSSMRVDEKTEQNQQINDDKQNLKTVTTENTTVEKLLQGEELMAKSESEYDENNDHNALRLVLYTILFSYLYNYYV